MYNTFEKYNSCVFFLSLTLTPTILENVYQIRETKESEMEKLRALKMPAGS